MKRYEVFNIDLFALQDAATSYGKNPCDETAKKAKDKLEFCKAKEIPEGARYFTHADIQKIANETWNEFSWIDIISLEIYDAVINRIIQRMFLQHDPDQKTPTRILFDGKFKGIPGDIEPANS